MSDVVDLLRRVREHKTFEDAADAALVWLHGAASSAMADARAASPVTWRGARCQGVSLFFTGRAGVFGLRRDGHGRDPAPRYSDSCWRWVQRHRDGIAGEVANSSFVALTPSGAVPDGLEAELRDSGFEEATRRHLKDATHLLAWPVLDAAGEPDGLVTVELLCTGQRFEFVTLGPRFLDDVRAVTELVAPLLRRLPRGALAPADLPRWAGERMRPLLAQLAFQSQVYDTLLLTGSPGTGKTELARWLHERSPRRDGPFEVVQLAALPVGLAHGHLFGWVKGAFSGAAGPHAGPVERAEGGTLFLDDIHRTPPEIQDALLGLLEGRTWRKLGTEEVRKADIRVIAASSVDIRRAASEGSVSTDLASRLIFNQVRVPDLDERTDEIGPWIQIFTEALRSRYGVPGRVTVAPEAEAELRRRRWPGNLRDLRETIVRAYALAVGSMPLETDAGPHIGLEHLPPPEVTSHAEVGGLEEALQRAASLLLDAAAARHDAIDLDDTEILGAMVADLAVARWGTSEGLRRIGRGSYVENKAGAALVKRLRARLHALRRKLGLS